MARYDKLVKVDGAAIKARREGLGLSRPEAAAVSGVSAPTWLAVEHGYRDPAERTLRKIEAALSRVERERGAQGDDEDDPPPAGGAANTPPVEELFDELERQAALLAELGRHVAEMPAAHVDDWSDDLRSAALGGDVSKIKPEGPVMPAPPSTGSFEPEVDELPPDDDWGA